MRPALRARRDRRAQVGHGVPQPTGRRIARTQSVARPRHLRQPGAELERAAPAARRPTASASSVLDYGDQRHRPDGAVRRHRSPPSRARSCALTGAAPRCPSSAISPGGWRSAATSPRPRVCSPTPTTSSASRRRAHGSAPRSFAGAGGAPRLRSVRRDQARRLRHSWQALRRAARGAAAVSSAVVLDALRRGRHALPVPGARGRHGDQRRPAGLAARAITPSTSAII